MEGNAQRYRNLWVRWGSLLCFLICIGYLLHHLTLSGGSHVENWVPVNEQIREEMEHVESGNFSESMIEQDEEPPVINVNEASLNDWTKIPGIGPVKAQSIVDYIHEHGPLNSIDELLEIKGIGEKTLEKMKPYLNLNLESGSS